MTITEITITVAGREFTVRADGITGGWIEAIAEVTHDNPTATGRRTAEWDGSGEVLLTASQCLAAAVQSIIETVEDGN